MSLRVCVVVGYDLSEEGGVKRNAMHVARALVRGGDTVTVIGPRSGGASESTVDGVKVRGFGGVVNIKGNGSDNRLGLFTSPLALRRFFRDNQFDVVHVHEPLLPALPLWAVALTRDAAHVCTFHGYAEDEGAFLGAARRRLGALLFGAFERGIAVSEPAATYAGVAWTRPLTIIPNGVPTGLYAPRSGAPRAPGPLRALFVGHYRDPRKGLPFLLQAMDLLRERGVAVSLDVVGKGPVQPAAPGVTYHGGISDEAVLAEHYRACDVFVAPSTGQESFGIVLLEGMAAGKPIVCSDIDGYRLVVPAEGALLAPRQDAVAIADALARLAGDASLRQRMGQVNLERAAAFDWDHLAGRIRDEYLLAIDARAARAAERRAV